MSVVEEYFDDGSENRIVPEGQQIDAVESVIRWYNSGTTKQVFSLAGYAGTGKTSIMKYIIDKLHAWHEIRFIAPTGKAASVLTHKGIPATTLHDLIYFPVEKIDPKTKKVYFVFEKKDDIDSNIRCIGVDEASMVSPSMLQDLLSYNRKILFVGDPEQLPPVISDKNGKDIELIRSWGEYADGWVIPYLREGKTDVFLTEIHRQQQGNPILELSKAIRNSRCNSNDILMRAIRDNPRILMGNKVCVVKNQNIDSKYYQKVDQVICGTRVMLDSINDIVRLDKGIDIYSGFPVVGDKIQCMKNNKEVSCDEHYLVNGMIGYIDKIGKFNPLTKSLEIDFRTDYGSLYQNLECNLEFMQKYGSVGLVKDRLNYFCFGNAVTCHKAQGSEWDNVMLIEEVLNPKRHKNWLYTGVTRAKNKLAVIAR